MIKIIKNTEWEPELGKENAFHYITFTPYSQNALSGYSLMNWGYAISQRITGFNEEKLCYFFRLVDNECTAGTLFPDYSVTFLPSPYFRSYSKKKLRELFDDIKKANTMIAKKDVYLDLRNGFAGQPDVLDCLEGTINEDYWKDYNLYIVMKHNPHIADISMLAYFETAKYLCKEFNHKWFVTILTKDETTDDIYDGLKNLIKTQTSEINEYFLFFLGIKSPRSDKAYENESFKFHNNQIAQNPYLRVLNLPPNLCDYRFNIPVNDRNHLFDIDDSAASDKERKELLEYFEIDENQLPCIIFVPGIYKHPLITPTVIPLNEVKLLEYFEQLFHDIQPDLAKLKSYHAVKSVLENEIKKLSSLKKGSELLATRQERIKECKAQIELIIDKISPIMQKIWKRIEQFR